MCATTPTWGTKPGATLAKDMARNTYWIRNAHTAPASLMSSQAAAAAACDEFLQSAHPSDAAREMIAAELLTRCGK
jgi:hypothetical protein